MASDPTEVPGAPASGEDRAAESAGGEMTQGGRYIPYSGGSAGWFENSGVLKSERRNNYQYHAVMDLPEVRAKLFMRWGPQEERRGGIPRKRRELPVNLLWEGSSVPMTTWDINNRGIRLQLTEAPSFSEGSELSVEVLGSPEGESRVLLDAQVIWMEEIGTTRKVWNVGMYFPNITAEAAVTLRELLEA